MQAEREPENSDRLYVLLPTEVVRGIDDYRRIHDDPNTRQELVRQILTEWLVLNRYLPPRPQPADERDDLS